jgi:hypothetical protein
MDAGHVAQDELLVRGLQPLGVVGLPTLDRLHDVEEAQHRHGSQELGGDGVEDCRGRVVHNVRRLHFATRRRADRAKELAVGLHVLLVGQRNGKRLASLLRIAHAQGHHCIPKGAALHYE